MSPVATCPIWKPSKSSRASSTVYALWCRGSQGTDPRSRPSDPLGPPAEPRAKPQHVTDEGVLVVDHDPRLAARTQHPQDLVTPPGDAGLRNRQPRPTMPQISFRSGANRARLGIRCPQASSGVCRRRGPDADATTMMRLTRFAGMTPSTWRLRRPLAHGVHSACSAAARLTPLRLSPSTTQLSETSGGPRAPPRGGWHYETSRARGPRLGNTRCPEG